MPTLSEIIDAVWSTEIQPGLTAREILAAWLRYQDSAGGNSSWNQWLQVDFPTGTPRYYQPRFAWSGTDRPATAPATEPRRIARRPASPSAPPPSSDRASERFAIREPDGGLLPRGLPPLLGGERTRDDEEALILALLMADD